MKENITNLRFDVITLLDSADQVITSTSMHDLAENLLNNEFIS